MTINIVLVFGVLMVVAGVGMVALWPDVTSFAALGGLALAAIAVPIVLYPVSYTLWQAVDLAMHPPSADDPGVPPPHR